MTARTYPVDVRHEPTRAAARAVALEMAHGDSRRLITMANGAVIITNNPGQRIPAPPR